MKKLPTLKPGDFVEIIAPASRCSDSQLLALRELLESWQLHCIVQEDIFGESLLFANTDEKRFEHLKNALQNPKTKAIISARGGYGSMRLIPKLMAIKPPEENKIFVGMSDTTCLQLFLLQKWGWPIIHGSAAPDRFSKESIAALKSLLFGEVAEVRFTELRPMNTYAQKNEVIQSTITGGNLALIQSGVGTSWQMDGRNKIILLEEVSERGYRVDRMLEHLQQAHILENAAALLFADFLDGNEPNGSSLLDPVIESFAKQSNIPVLRMKGIGHGPTNFPIPCGTKAHLQLGEMAQLVVSSS